MVLLYQNYSLLQIFYIFLSPRCLFLCYVKIVSAIINIIHNKKAIVSNIATIAFIIINELTYRFLYSNLPIIIDYCQILKASCTIYVLDELVFLSPLTTIFIVCLLLARPLTLYKSC